MGGMQFLGFPVNFEATELVLGSGAAPLTRSKASAALRNRGVANAEH